MFGSGFWVDGTVPPPVMNPFTRSTTPGAGSGDGFDAWDAFDPEHNPSPGPFLEDHDVLAGDDHLAFHRLTRELFEERGVYDATFGYNLARLNLDQRHPEAGFRYAVDADDPTVLRAEFTPTTEFCPQADALVKGAFRAWNGLTDRHEYDLVRVRVHSSHHQSDGLNATLAELETEFRETGTVPGEEEATGTGRDGREETTAESPF